jgi:DNA-binding MarR family transcriptional regulator
VFARRPPKHACTNKLIALEAGHDTLTGVSPRASKSSVLSQDELAAWSGFVRAHSYLVRELDKDLQRSHRLGQSSYQVLLQLAIAPRGRLRMTALADAVLLSPSGLTRLVDQLEREGLVVRERREDDARSYDAVLSPQGRKLAKAATQANLRRVRELFIDRLSEAQITQLIAIWTAVDPQFAAPRPALLLLTQKGV